MGDKGKKDQKKKKKVKSPVKEETTVSTVLNPTDANKGSKTPPKK